MDAYREHGRLLGFAIRSSECEMYVFTFLQKSVFVSCAHQRKNISQAAFDWPVAMGLYVVGLISYGCTLVLYLAAFPRLARNTATSKEARRKYEAGESSREEREESVSLEHNRVSNICVVSRFFWQNLWPLHIHYYCFFQGI